MVRNDGQSRGLAIVAALTCYKRLAKRARATLVHLRHGATHDVLACWFRVDRSTITRAIGEVRPLLAERGRTIAAGIRLRNSSAVLMTTAVPR